jgi:hypothetical protein
MKKLSIILFFSALVFSACVFSSNNEKPNSAGTKPANEQNASAEKSGSGAGSNQTSKLNTAENAAKTEDCLKIKAAGKKIDEKQTFAFDYEPFKNACFVTAHDPEYDDPPLNSEFFIYKDGKEVYKFNGVTTGCWTEGVSFQDLNEDGLTDVIVAGMCSAKSAPYSENMVYVNKGKEFKTNENANYTLEKFKKIKDIADFVKQNKEQFFR